MLGWCASPRGSLSFWDRLEETCLSCKCHCRRDKKSFSLTRDSTVWLCFFRYEVTGQQAIFSCQTWKTSGTLLFWLLSDLILPYDIQILLSSCYNQGRSWLRSWALTGVSPSLQTVPSQLAWDLLLHRLVLLLWSSCCHHVAVAFFQQKRLT